jgi:pterin-4a-carbinolamine dehydratase
MVTNTEATLVYSYTRAQAIDDGVLYDLTKIAPEVCHEHYKTHVACTADVMSLIRRAVEHPDWCNDYNGVIHDILWMSRCPAARVLTLSESSHVFRVIITGTGRRTNHDLKIVCSAGDAGEPVITIMKRNED